MLEYTYVKNKKIKILAGRTLLYFLTDKKVKYILSIMWQSFMFWQVKVSVLSCCLQVGIVPQLCIGCSNTASNVSPDELVLRILQG